MSLISVVVPVYNVELYIERCINSILEQTFREFKLILVDDGSTDTSGEICDRYATEDKRICVIHQTNKGLSGARNSGIEWVLRNYESEWITFIDSDDWIHPQYLEKLMLCVCTNNVNIGVCSFEIVNEYKNSPKYEDVLYEVLDPEEFYIRDAANATVAWGKIYPTEKFRFIRYPEGKLHEDVFVTHELLFAENKIGVINCNLYYYYKNINGITHTISVKRLRDSLEGQRRRLQYFKDNEFYKVYNYELNSISYNSDVLKAIYMGIEQSDKKYVKILRKRIRKKIKTDRIDFKDHIWVYEFAYPKCMYVYWRFIWILQKLNLHK